MTERRMKFYLSLVLFFIIWISSPPALCADTPDTSARAIEKNDFNRALENLKKEKANEILPPEPSESPQKPVQGLSYTASQEMREELGRVLYDDFISRLKHNRIVFEWQLYSSRVIFWVVLSLVAIGIFFSGVQFYKALRAPQPNTKSERLSELTELEISARGLKVSSPVLGVIILVISLAFLYLFLVHVYPIKHVRDQSFSQSVSNFVK